MSSELAVDKKLPGIKSSVITLATALLLGVLFGLFGPRKDVRFIFGAPDDPLLIPDLVVRADQLNIALGTLTLLLAAGVFALRQQGKKTPLGLIFAVGFLFLVGLLGWIAAGAEVRVEFILGTALVLSVPLMLGAMAGVMSERVGVVNIAIEAQLLTGAFMAAVVGTLTQNLFLGLIAAALGAAVLSTILAVFSIRYLAQQIIVGVVLNVLMLGVTNFLYQQWLTPQAATANTPGTLDIIRIPFLMDIPVLGSVLFENRITTFLAIFVVILVWFVLFKTKLGLRARAVGENPLAADTLGINVERTRFWWVVAGGAVAGLGGAALSIGSSGAFGRGMSVGYGFIALAIVILGKWHPLRAAAAALLFGFSIIFQIWANSVNPDIPSDFVLMVPYLVTIIAVVGFVGRSRPPAAGGVPYVKGGSR